MENLDSDITRWAPASSSTALSGTMMGGHSQRGSAMVADQKISSGGPWEESVGYSRATIAGDTVHVSGSTATINGAVQHHGDAFAQTLTALGVIEKALQEAGHTLEDVVRTRIYVASAEDMGDVGRAHGQIFGDIRPAATMIAGIQFINEAILVEIEAESYKKRPGEDGKIGGDGGI